MKYLSLATVPLLCATVAPLCADVDNMISQGNMNSNSQMSNQMNQTKNSRKQLDQMWRDNAITPMAEPKPDGNFNPYITADFIYWKTYEQGLAYAYNGVDELNGMIISHPTSSGKLMTPDFEWEPGFKVGLGNKFMHDGWDLYAQYTWLNSDAEDNESEEKCCETISVVAESNYWLKTIAGPEDIYVTEEGARWNLNSFNVLDLELGRNYYISKCLTLRPFAGLKFSWMRQKYKVKYNNVEIIGDSSGVYSSTDTIPFDSNVKMNLKQREFGVGLRAGMNTEWYFCKYLGAYGDLAFTALWNRFRDHREVEINTPEATEYNSEKIKSRIYDVTAVVEIGLGLFFEWAWHNDNYMFTLAAGWENQIWFNQNNMIFLMNNNAPGNLSFQGFTLKAGFAF